MAILAQRLGMVLASVTTWHRLVRDRQWRRPRQRVHPTSPKVGIRASRPNEIWHIDTAVVRLLDASRAYLHAVIDNYSRRILAWKVSATFNPHITAELLLTASKHVVDVKQHGLEFQCLCVHAENRYRFSLFPHTFSHAIRVTGQRPCPSPGLGTPESTW